MALRRFDVADMNEVDFKFLEYRDIAKACSIIGDNVCENIITSSRREIRNAFNNKLIARGIVKESATLGTFREQFRFPSAERTIYTLITIDSKLDPAVSLMTVALSS
jgi:hypothetical protein